MRRNKYEGYLCTASILIDNGMLHLRVELESLSSAKDWSEVGLMV